MENFNYNDGGRREAGYQGTTGDCVCRAIAIATDTSYQDVYGELNSVIGVMRQTKRVKGSNARTGVWKNVYDEYLKQRGWKWNPTMQIGSGCKVHLKKSELPPGRIIVRLSRHLAAVIDGVVNDNHDCSRNGTRCVYGYYSKQQTNP